jgi:hypothetical protein
VTPVVHLLFNPGHGVEFRQHDLPAKPRIRKIVFVGSYMGLMEHLVYGRWQVCRKTGGEAVRDASVVPPADEASLGPPQDRAVLPTIRLHNVLIIFFTSMSRHREMVLMASCPVACRSMAKAKAV